MAFGKKTSFFGNLAQSIGDVFLMRPVPDEEMIDELEELLITADIGMDTTIKITDSLRDAIRHERLRDADEVKTRIRQIVEEMLDKGERNSLNPKRPLVIMMIGVNGVGKTTSIAKLAASLKEGGQSVLLVAADTFRAAASEQLSIWAGRLDVPIIKHKEGADPAAVIFDGMQAAKARGTDVVICDTAGRLQNKKNLMAELGKMYKVIDREFPEAEREVLLVLDATTGKNAVSQAKEFGEVTDLSGIVLTKMDGTAKGGIVVTISDEFDLPVKYIGLGEGMNDLKEFNAKEFAESIFEEQL